MHALALTAQRFSFYNTDRQTDIQTDTTEYRQHG